MASSARHLTIIAAAGASWWAVGCHGRRDGDRVGHFIGQEARTSINKEVHGQNRINSFFYAGLVPKLQPCWARVQGKGEITFEYLYKKQDTNWVWQSIAIDESDLPSAQATLALQCMEDAAKRSSFPMEAAEAAHGGVEFHVHWTWQVPFPTDVTTLGRMIGGSGNGGECRRTCADCDFLGKPSHCKAVCYGYQPPCKVESDGNGCNFPSPAVCASGRMGAGLVIME